MIINAFEHVFPIAGGEWKEPGKFKAKNIFGTSFSLKNNIYITAHHVVKEIEALGLSFAIAITENNNFLGYPILSYDSFPDLDLTIIKTKQEVPGVKQFKWNFDQLSMLDDVGTVGFPHALDFTSRQLFIRSFKGYVISCGSFSRLKANPLAYEMSFTAPSGLSGAPVIAEKGMTVKGYVIGNSKIKIPDLDDVEKITENDKTTIVERYEMCTFGTAIQNKSILDVESEILDGTLIKFLENNNLIG